jgi:hypothetical protein
MEVLTIVAIILVILAIWLPFLVWLVGGFDSTSPYPIINRLQTSGNWIRTDSVQPVPWNIIINNKIGDEFPTSLSITMSYISYGYSIVVARFTMTGTLSTDGNTITLTNATNITQGNEAIPKKVVLTVSGKDLIVTTDNVSFRLVSESG